MTLKKYMEKHKLTCEDMGDKLGVTKGHVSHLLTGRRKASKWLALKIHQVTMGKVRATSLNKDARL